MVGRAHLRQAKGRVRKLVEKWIEITHQEMNKVSVFILADFECLTMQCIGKSKNGWIRPFLQAWHRPPFSLLPRWRDGLHVLYALAQHPTAIPEYNHTIPYPFQISGSKKLPPCPTSLRTCLNAPHRPRHYRPGDEAIG